MTNLLWIVAAIWAGLATGASADQGTQEARASPSPLTARPLLFAPPSMPAVTLRHGDWAKARCGSVTFPTPGVSSWQWTPALDGPGYDYGNDGWVVSGTVVAPAMSDSDNPLVHPFGYDFDWYLAVDPHYDYLLALGNASDNQDFGRITRHARSLGLDVPHGVLGIEMDSGLLPPAYRVRENDRIVIAGRWIVDCGHEDFHTEIHPPLLIAAARTLPSSGGIVMTITSRPWLVGQTYREGNFVDHLRREFERLPDVPLTRYCCSSQVEIHDPILPPFSSSGDYDYWLAIPANETQSARIRYHFAVRRGVRVQLYRANPSFVGIHVILDAAKFIAAPLPPKRDMTYTPAALEKLDQDGRVKSGYDEARRRLGVLFWAKAALAKGIRADAYEQVKAPFLPCDPSGSMLPLRALNKRRIEIPVDWTRDDQPFPVIGWVEVDP